MYKIIYQKENGIIFERIRSSLPGYEGDKTSMGWTILKILYSYNGNYYPFPEYCRLMSKFRKRSQLKRNIKMYIKKYASISTLIVLIPIASLILN